MTDARRGFYLGTLQAWNDLADTIGPRWTQDCALRNHVASQNAALADAQRALESVNRSIRKTMKSIGCVSAADSRFGLRFVRSFNQ